MNLREFRKAGHWPTLFSAFLYFDISFMIWVMIGALAVSISADLWPKPADVPLEAHLAAIAPKKGFLIAVPLLGGSILRILLGLLTDHIGARRTGLIGLVLSAIPLVLGWLWADSMGELILVGLMLGVAGASFAVALPLAGRWYPPQHQGLAMGIAGAGNSGTALATLFGPLLAKYLGWHVVFGLALIPLALTLITFFLLAKDSPSQPPPKSLFEYGIVLGRKDAWWFCFFYAITFGGFVGLASFLNTFFKDQYFSTDPKSGAVYAGYFTTACVVAGSFLRPVGGYLADRVGGVRMLLLLFAGIGLLLFGVATLPPVWFAGTLLAVTMGMLGMGNGAVFQIVPQRFPKEIGVLTGLVGAAGGLGGFFLPNLLGVLKKTTGSYGSGFLAFALLALVAGVLIRGVAWGWEKVAPPVVVSIPRPARQPILEATT
ncbi:MAG TPA: MFS transporter [Gemmataceae bacterium]|jgi:NNP family nitrate/nitrite transporter-like MFS transporter|nr:MFS transporter [Gemmataceae bacterium]